MMRTIKRLMQTTGRGIRLEHTHGHQDKQEEFENLPLPVKLNVMCDKECERKLKLVQDQRIQTSRREMMSGAEACIAVEGRPVTGKIVETLAKKILEESGKTSTYGLRRIQSSRLGEPLKSSGNREKPSIETDNMEPPLDTVEIKDATQEPRK